jgi:hypothetical protein
MSQVAVASLRCFVMRHPCRACGSGAAHARRCAAMRSSRMGACEWGERSSFWRAAYGGLTHGEELHVPSSLGSAWRGHPHGDVVVDAPPGLCDPTHAAWHLWVKDAARSATVTTTCEVVPRWECRGAVVPRMAARLQPASVRRLALWTCGDTGRLVVSGAVHHSTSQVVLRCSQVASYCVQICMSARPGTRARARRGGYLA